MLLAHATDDDRLRRLCDHRLFRHLRGQADRLAEDIMPAAQTDHIADQVLQQIHSSKGTHEVQRQEEEEEEMQMKREAAIQRQEIPEEEEELMMQRDMSAQRQEIPEEEEELMMQQEVAAQRQEIPEEEEALQMHPDGTAHTSNTLTTAIQNTRGHGHTLSSETRKPMERAFGSSFDNVHIHADPEADQMSRSMQARAFTVGSDIYFRQDAYRPQTTSGQKLLAHELTHVIQQGSAPAQSQMDEQTDSD